MVFLLDEELPGYQPPSELKSVAKPTSKRKGSSISMFGGLEPRRMPPVLTLPPSAVLSPPGSSASSFDGRSLSGEREAKAAQPQKSHQHITKEEIERVLSGLKLAEPEPESPSPFL